MFDLKSTSDGVGMSYLSEKLGEENLSLLRPVVYMEYCIQLPRLQMFADSDASMEKCKYSMQQYDLAIWTPEGDQSKYKAPDRSLPKFFYPMLLKVVSEGDAD